MQRLMVASPKSNNSVYKSLLVKSSLSTSSSQTTHSSMATLLRRTGSVLTRCAMRGVWSAALGLCIVFAHPQRASLASNSQVSLSSSSAQANLSSQGEAGSNGAIALSDEELGDVSAGDFQPNDLKLTLDQFNVSIQNNQAGLFTFDIGQNAFQGAQGIFTTLQLVNSAVDLNVIVNIFLNGFQQGS